MEVMEEQLLLSAIPLVAVAVVDVVVNHLPVLVAQV